MERRVAVFVGSLRAASWNRKVARALIALAPHSLQAEMERTKIQVLAEAK